MKKNRLAIRWQLVAGYLGIVIALMACATIGGTPVTVTVTTTATEPALMQLENGAVEVREESGNWVPVGGETTFEIVGILESTDPWMVTGNTFATREWTEIDEGLEAGDLVRVKGIILDDATWQAASIERAEEEPTSPTIVLVGKVTSIDPWMVNGITLNITSDTLINEGITTGMIVRVVILLLEDGTWEVLSIASLGNFTDVPGCATITARVVGVNDNEIQLAGWPVITIGAQVVIENDAGEEATLSPDQMILVVVCATRDDQIRITHIIILSPTVDDPPADGGAEKQLVCHKPNKNGGHTLSIASSAVPAHLGHGDTLGACP